MKEWEVDLTIYGPITLEQSLVRTNPLKGDVLPFQTNVILKKTKEGVVLSLKARADSLSEATEAAIYYVGRAADILCLRTDLNIYVGAPGSRFIFLEHHTRQIISEEFWKECFELGRKYGTERSTFSRALSWYRKGNSSENVVDKFMAYWNALEVVGSKYAQQNEKTRQGSKNSILNCFDQMWGNSTSWKVIPNGATIFDDITVMRNKIFHGDVLLVDMTEMNEFNAKLPILRSVAYQFLSSWHENGTNIERNHTHQTR